VLPILNGMAPVPHDTRIRSVTCGVFRALGGGRVFVDQVVQNGFPADPFSIDVGHRGAASVTVVVRDTDSGAQDRGASGPGRRRGTNR